MPGHLSVRPGRIPARYVRGLGAAVVAMAALIAASNAGPARAADPGPVQHTQPFPPMGHIQPSRHIGDAGHSG